MDGQGKLGMVGKVTYGQVKLGMVKEKNMVGLKNLWMVREDYGPFWKFCIVRESQAWLGKITGVFEKLWMVRESSVWLKIIMDS